MAEVAYPEPDAKVDVMAHEAANQMHSNKRKRSSLDHEPPRPAPSYQRGSTNSANNTTQDQPDSMDQYTEEALHGMTTADFNALAQHNQNGQAASASDTAAAALSQHYSMTAPGGNDA